MDHNDFIQILRGLLTDGAVRSTVPDEVIDAVTVRRDDRVLQIIAGPGSGKTEVLIWRILAAMFVDGIPASQIVVTTFTRKAAGELATRAVRRTRDVLLQARTMGKPVADPGAQNLRIGTLHSLCTRLLAEFDLDFIADGLQLVEDNEATAWMMNFAVRNGDFIRLAQSRNAVSLRLGGANAASPMSLSMYRQCAHLVGPLLSQYVETWYPRCGPAGTPISVPDIESSIHDLSRLWDGYLRTNRLMTFATVQRRFLESLHGGYMASAPIAHVFVDEFQDTNPIQYAIYTDWLDAASDAGPVRLTVVGDDDQAIYRFRGSDPACFGQLSADCTARGVAFREVRLEDNMRSDEPIVEFNEAFRTATLETPGWSVAKSIRSAKPSPPSATLPTFVLGSWSNVCAWAAADAASRPPGETRAALLASTSEAATRYGPAAALQLREAFERAGLGVSNPRRKMASAPGSATHTIFALVSYFFAPVLRGASTGAPQLHEKAQRSFAATVPAEAQGPLLDAVDELRRATADAVAAGATIGLTLAGVVARLLAQPYFRGAGPTEVMNEARFAELVESFVAVTRSGTTPLDLPLAPRLTDGVLTWPHEIAALLNSLGELLDEENLNDVEHDGFAADIHMMTFHQAKGLEFDSVYVALTGKNPSANNVALNNVFSGEAPGYHLNNKYWIVPGAATLAVAQADTAREVYVALSRARERLIILCDPDDERWMSGLHSGLAALRGSGLANEVQV